VLVVTASSGRVETLRNTIGKITDQIFWLTTLDQLTREGALATIWQRPADGTFNHSLTQPQ
jgi:hypothetical protein